MGFNAPLVEAAHCFGYFESLAVSDPRELLKMTTPCLTIAVFQGQGFGGRDGRVAPYRLTLYLSIWVAIMPHLLIAQVSNLFLEGKQCLVL